MLDQSVVTNKPHIVSVCFLGITFKNQADCSTVGASLKAHVSITDN